jgi:hypothetical protein
MPGLPPLCNLMAILTPTRRSPFASSVPTLQAPREARGSDARSVCGGPHQREVATPARARSRSVSADAGLFRTVTPERPVTRRLVTRMWIVVSSHVGKSRGPTRAMLTGQSADVRQHRRRQPFTRTTTDARSDGDRGRRRQMSHPRPALDGCDPVRARSSSPRHLTPRNGSILFGGARRSSLRGRITFEAARAQADEPPTASSRAARREAMPRLAGSRPRRAQRCVLRSAPPPESTRRPGLGPYRGAGR